MLSLQTQLNNFSNAVIDLSFNEMIYGFKVRETISSLTSDTQAKADLSAQRLKYRREVSEAIAFANIKARSWDLIERLIHDIIQNA